MSTIFKDTDASKATDILPSKAVVVNGTHSGCVLFYAGRHITEEIEETGLHTLSDLGLDDAPFGINIWEGVYVWVPGNWEYPQDVESRPEGSFRPPTNEEWQAIMANQNPWSPVDQTEE